VAYAQITHVFPDGSRVTVRTGTDRGDGAYPDQLAELNARLLDLYKTVVVDVDPNNAE
jgi:hypothetical protein